MKSHIRSLTAACAVALVATFSAPAAAQQQQQPPQQQQQFDPQPMAADHPLAKQAAALVEQILAGNRDAVIAAMKKDGTEQLAANPNLEKMVDAQIERLAKKGYKISEFTTGIGADVIVRLKGDAGEEHTIIRFTPAAPYKYAGFARLQQGGN